MDLFFVQCSKEVSGEEKPEEMIKESYHSQVYAINNKVKPTEFLLWNGENFVWESMVDCIAIDFEE